MQFLIIREDTDGTLTIIHEFKRRNPEIAKEDARKMVSNSKERINIHVKYLVVGIAGTFMWKDIMVGDLPQKS